MKKLYWQPLLAVVALTLAALACGPFSALSTGSLSTSTSNFSGEDIDQLNASLAIGAGELQVGGGGTDLVEAVFEYNIEEWAPISESSANGTTGRFTARQPAYEGIPIGDDVINRWDITFNDDVPLDLAVELGAGDSTLALQSLNLQDFSLNAGAGDVTIELGSANLTDVDIQAGVGKLDVDLTGNWESDADIRITGGVGDLNLLLPKDVGVIVNLSVGLGDINASGLNVDGDSYTNDAYGSSTVTLYVDFTGGVGAITLRVED
ncbi:MAG: hypothetical protein KDE09_00790 [Anaerolineales bacterium]|nr:hypothetical protein [Anaerolineales bacterium]